MAVSSNPPGPLSVGNVISAGIRLYSDHFKDYFKTALIATLWILLPLLATAILIIFYAIVQDFYPLLGLAIPALLVLFFYCLARYLAGAATIARLAFKELSQQPEAVEAANRFTRSRLWSFLGLSVLLGLLYTGITIAIYIITAIIGIAVFAVTGAASFFSSSSIEQVLSDNPGLAVGLVLGVLLLILIMIIFFIWLGSRLAIPELPLAVESEINASSSISRSWQLTKRHAWRIFLILLVTSLISFPILMLAQVITSVLQSILLAFLSAETVAYSTLLVLISYISSFLSNVFMLPLWQAIKATIYYDLRSRREGFDLTLRDRQI